MSEDEEAEQLSPRVVHNHYEQHKNGNGMLAKFTITVAGVLLTLLVGMQGFMWRAQLDFQNEVTDRLARVETVLEGLN